MKLSVKVNQTTTASELIILGALFESLALAREGRISSVSADEPLTAPVDPAELHEPETVVVQAAPAAGEEAPKRRRRSKEEIDAANQRHVQKGIAEAEAKAGEAAAPEPEAPAPTEPEQAIPPGAPGNDQPAPTQPAPVTDTAPAQAPAEPEPATESPSDGKTYAAADVQQLATVVARTHGADLVKGKIAELGGARIADLKQEQLNALGVFLANVK